MQSIFQQDPQDPQGRQDPQRAVTRDRLSRLLKARADGLMKPSINDRGTVLDPGIDDPGQAMHAALDHFHNYVKGFEEHHAATRAYLTGESDDMPPDWLLNRDQPMTSLRTIREQGKLDEVRQFREDNPVMAGIHDYVTDPVGDFLAQRLQVPLDVAAGAVNLFGAEITPVNIKDGAAALMQAAVSDFSVAEAYDDFQLFGLAREQDKSGAARVLHTAGHIAGLGRALSQTSGVLSFPAGGMRAGGALLSKAMGKIQGVAKGAAPTTSMRLANSAGAFGAYEAIVARGDQGEAPKSAFTGEGLWQRADAYGHGLLAGTAIFGASEVVKRSARALFQKTAQSLHPSEKAFVKTLTEWGAKNRMFKPPAMSEGAFAKRLADAWADAGAPGLKMPTQRLRILAQRGGLEGAAFTTLDEKFREQAVDVGLRMMRGEDVTSKEWSYLVETYLGNAIGVAGMHVGLKDIPMLQRFSRPEPLGMDPSVGVKGVDEMASPESMEAARQGMLEHIRKEAEADRRFHQAEQGKETGEVPRDNQKALDDLGKKSVGEHKVRQVEEAKEAGEDVGGREAELKKDPHLAEQAARETAEGEAARAEAEVQRAQLFDFLHERVRGRDRLEQEWADSLEIEPTDLMRLGWRYTEKGAMEIPGTPFRMEIGPDSIILSKAMAKALGLKTKIGRGPKVDPDFIGPRQPNETSNFGDAVYRASLLSAVRSKMLLRGLDLADGTTIDIRKGKPIMRAVRMGEVYEKPLTPKARWVRATKALEARGKDPIPRDQVELIETLKTILDHKADLSREDTAALSSVIELLDTVSRETDPAVAEAVQFMPELIRDLTEGEPMVASGSIRMMQEALTTKTPEQFVEVVEQQARAQHREERTRGDLQRATREHEFAEDASAEVKVSPRQAKVLKPFVSSDSPFGKAIGEVAGGKEIGKATITPPELKKLQSTFNKYVPRVRGRLKSTDRKRFEAAQQSAYSVIEKAAAKLGVRRPGEEGHAIAPDVVLGEVGKALARPVVTAVQAVGGVVNLLTNNRATRFWVEDMATQVREALPEFGERIFNAEANAQRFSTVLDAMVQQVAEHGSKRVPELEKIEWTGSTEGEAEAGYRHSHIYKETSLMERFGKTRKSLSDQSQKLYRAWDAATTAIRDIANRLGVPVASTTKRNVMTRQMSPWAIDTLLHGGTSRMELFRVLGRENGMTVDQVKDVFESEGWTDARALRKLDPIEQHRKFKFFPDHMRRPGGQIVELLETSPLAHAKRMTRNAAMRMGVVEEFGQDGYQKMIDELPFQHQDLAARALRMSMGMAVNKSMVKPDRRGAYRFLEVLHSLGDVLAAAKLTMAPLYNITEPLGTGSAMIGARRMADALSETWGDAFSGRIKDTIQERMDRGGFSLHTPEWMSGIEGPSRTEKVRSAARSTTSALMIPFELSQAIADVAVHRAADGWISDMQAGKGNRGHDTQTLQALWGMGKAEAAKLAKGEGSAKQYENLLLTALPRITRRSDQPINKSDFATQNNLSKWIRFTGFFQRQMATTRRLGLAMRHAETAAEATDAAVQFGRMLGFNSFAFMGGQSLVSFIKGGPEEFLRMWGDAVENPGTTFSAAMTGSLFGGMGATVAGGLYTALTGQDPAEVGESISRMAFPLSEGREMMLFGEAMMHRVVLDKPIGSGPYSGKSPLQQLGYFVGREIPLVRTGMSGLFGLGATYLGTDPQLENAMRANYRWDRKYLDEQMTYGDPGDDRAMFLDTMRKAMLSVKSKAGFDADEAERIIRTAIPEEDNRNIAKSLRARRVLTGRNWTKLTPEQQGSKRRVLGPDTIELLLGYDAALEILAMRFR